jgi:hypothetical protein
MDMSELCELSRTESLKKGKRLLSGDRSREKIGRSVQRSLLGLGSLVWLKSGPSPVRVHGPNYLWHVLLIIVVNILLLCSKDISGMKADFYCKHPNKIMLVFVINYCCKYVSDLL